MTLRVGGKAAPIQAPRPKPLPFDLDKATDSELQFGRRQWAKGQVRVELTAIDAVSDLGALISKSQKQAAWLRDQWDDPRYDDRQAKHLTTQAELAECRATALRDITRAIRGWATCPDNVKREIHNDEPASALGSFVVATLWAICDPALESPMCYPTQSRRGLALLLEQTPDEWVEGRA